MQHCSQSAKLTLKGNVLPPVVREQKPIGSPLPFLLRLKPPMREPADPLCKARCTFYSTTMQGRDKHLWQDMGKIDMFVLKQDSSMGTGQTVNLTVHFDSMHEQTMPHEMQKQSCYRPESPQDWTAPHQIPPLHCQ